MAIEIFELLEVEPGRAFADMADIEPFDRLIAADDLVVAMTPAKPQLIIEQGLGEDAEVVAIGIDPQCPVPLA